MASPMRELAPEETDLRGDWVVRDDRPVVADASEDRIEWLTRQKLERIANDSTGWEILYRDPRDGRIWELTYPRGEMHGGGTSSARYFAR